ncbi:exo-beta-N-acetylmuramidase NamZ family protein [Limnochorda pilosa]|uniref:DUF1343 domain-containing protein n=1 Tax=Limnochorda pilosa TaxID=1555112 RepID=A0A0K2SME8_LIMPI|nr:DUF1343 domain-containing protein [Limnochorda pilosa]BAS28280.1 hypothetical protein LIP_2439 [Limnochorda pilosa]
MSRELGSTPGNAGHRGAAREDASRGGAPHEAGPPSPRVRVGAEVLVEDLAGRLQGRRVALLTNGAAIDGQARWVAERVVEAGARLVALFGPEHGLRGEAQAGVKVGDTRDPRWGVPVHSLYGATHRPTPEALKDVELFLCDLPDGGSRYWTFIATASEALEACGEQGIPFLLLDRPNPVGGVEVEGNVLDPAFRSLVGYHPMPIRHGLTLGEILSWRAAAGLGRGALEVVPVQGWRRTWRWRETGLPWASPSPNVPSPETLLLYPGTCLVEGTNLSEGRGTAHSFRWIGAPWIDPDRLAQELNGRGLPGVRFRPVFFEPTFSKHAGHLCAGVEPHVLDPEAFRPVRTGLHLLDALRRQRPEAFAWVGGERPFIDLLAGGEALRHHVEEGRDPDALADAWESQAAAFRRDAEPFLLYADAGRDGGGSRAGGAGEEEGP